MATIAWKEIYQTGIVALDDEHKQLVAQIDRLFQAVRDKQGDDVLQETFEMLKDYTEKHFQHEEKLMQEYGFPGLEEHRQIHQQLRDSVDDMISRNSSDPQQLAKELLAFLRVWLLEHIVNVDKKYGVFLESRAGRFIS
ncbi:hemerythrin [Malonomonas rubra DSM 5091]|uniref:Hemerythrin n=1 Tax=Malonomonas rubra DSM 5091 TaxID=1122189 RepID=A0A1M6F5C5_MALRU|nr:bacteriohemerythrin [Malonomonas rubra]SHI92905.1 hemerythrin [Malonomonas rubra DSM 5091]